MEDKIKPKSGRGMVTSTPAPQGPNNKFAEDDPSDISGPPTPKLIVKYQTALDMILDAIRAIGLPRKGASFQAIKKWIMANREVSERSLKFGLKKGILKGIESGVLKRPNQSQNALGCLGSFVVAPSKSVKAPPKTKKSDKIKTSKPSNSKDSNDMKDKTKVLSKKPAKAVSKKRPKGQLASSPPNDPKGRLLFSESEEENGGDSPKPARQRKVNTAKITKEQILVKTKQLTKSKNVVEKVLGQAKKVKENEAKSKGKAKQPKTNQAENILENEESVEAEMKIPKAVTKEKNLVKTKEPSTKLQNVVDKVPGRVKKVKENEAKSKGNAKQPKTNQAENILENEEMVEAEMKIPKAVKHKKMYKPKEKLEMSRKDLSDTEVDARRDRLKSFKSYASDTELEITKREEKRKIIKTEETILPKRVRKAADSEENTGNKDTNESTKSQKTKAKRGR